MEYANDAFMAIYLCRNEDATLFVRVDVGSGGIPILRYIVAVRVAGQPVPSTRFTDADIPAVTEWLLEAGKFEYDLHAVPYMTIMQALGENFQLVHLAQDADAFAQRGLDRLEQQNRELLAGDAGAKIPDPKSYSYFSEFVSTLDFDEEIPNGE